MKILYLCMGSLFKTFYDLNSEIKKNTKVDDYYFVTDPFFSEKFIELKKINQKKIIREYGFNDTTDYFDDRIAVNLKHQFFTIKAIYKSMEKSGGGTIVNMGSVSWMIGQGGMPIYLSCKSAIVGLTRSMARDLGPKNIRVNSVLPGWIMTERQKKLWLTPEGEEELLRRQCLKRKLEPEEIAKIVLFFSSEDSGVCTNQNFVADGGWV